MTYKTWMSGAAAAAVLSTLGAAAPAQAHDHYGDYRGGYYAADGYDGRYSRDYRREYYRSYDARPGYYRGYAYRGRAADYRYRCGRSDGATGTILGAIAGGLIGSSAAGRHGDKTAGVIIGGAVGAVAGRAIDKSGNRC